MNNTKSTIVQNIINKIPTTLYFKEIPDRQQALNYIDWLYQNVPESKTVDQDMLIREVIARELRATGMKIIDIHILIIIALQKVTLDDFKLSDTDLVRKVISQNIDKNDLDTMYRAMGQVMSRLPCDLREQITGVQKLRIFQEFTKAINIDPKLLEKFVALDPSLNTPITMELDAGDYNTLKKKYSEEMKKYEAQAPYLNSDSLEHVISLKKKLNNIPSLPTNPDGTLKAQYIDNSPMILQGIEDKIFYYYDESSGAITEIPINGNQVPISIGDLETILLANKISREEVKRKIEELTGKTLESKVPAPSVTSGGSGGIGSYFSSIKSYFFGSEPAPVETKTTMPIITRIQKVVPATTTTTLPATTIPVTTTTTVQAPPATTVQAPPTTTRTPSTTAQISGFENMGDSKITEAKLIENMKKNNSNIEKVAIGFVLVLILMFLAVMFNSIRSGGKN